MDQKMVSPQRIAKKILLGTVLGDGFVGNGSKLPKAVLILTQGARQFEYLLWKMKALVPLVKDYYVKIRTSSGGKPIVQAVTTHQRLLYHTWKDMYNNIDGKIKKVVKLNVLRRLTPLSLACWHMDDGSLYVSNGLIKGLRLATYGFSYDEQHIIKQYFAEIGITVNVASYKPDQNGKQYHYIGMKKKETEKFINMIQPHVHKTMQYKIDPSKHCAEHEYTREDIVRTLQKCKEFVRNNESILVY